MTYLELLTKINTLLDTDEEISQFDEIDWERLMAIENK